MKNKQEIIDKYTICGLWVTMSASIVLLCIALFGFKKDTYETLYGKSEDAI